MDSLNGITIFVQVADTRSFTEAGRLLGVSSSAIGKSIARMEERLGVRLFHRNTRSMTLTAEGALFLERCRRILSEVEAAETELSDATTSPRGRLRVSVPQLTAMLMPVMNGFMQKYPDIVLDIDLSDQMVDIVEEGFDAVLRTGEQNDSRLAARRLGVCPLVLVGSPAYFQRKGVPRAPADLAAHACLLHKFKTSGKIEPWRLRRGPADAEPVLPEAMTANNVEALIRSALDGLGIAFVPLFAVREAVAQGLLQTVLDDYLERTVIWTLLWPANKHSSPKLRVFIDYLSEHLFPVDAVRTLVD